MADPQRDARFDNLKGLLIFLVVLGHLLELTKGPLAVWLYRVIYSFHMPAFTFCTGYFSRFSAKRFLGRILYPYFVYQTLYLLFARYLLHREGPLQYTTPYWLLWYLLSMALWTLLLPVIDQLQPRWAALPATFALALLAGFDPTIGYSLSLSRTLVLLPFFVSGYLCAHRPLSGQALSPVLLRRLRLGLAVWVLLAGRMLWRRRAGIQSSWFYESHSYESADYSLSIRLLLLLISAGWILWLLLCMPRKPLPLLATLGRNTMPVFLLHGFFVKYLAWQKVFDGSFRHEFSAILATAVALCALLGNPVTGRLFAFTFSAQWLTDGWQRLRLRLAKRQRQSAG